MRTTAFGLAAVFSLGCAFILRAADPPGPNAVDFTDPSYGTRIRQLKKDDGHEHNLYYYREPWNADGTRMVAVQSDLEQKNWRVCLYDGDGGLVKELFGIENYDWRLCWDRKDPNLLYTWKGAKLYAFNVVTGQADLLKDFAPLALSANGPSLNQAGDRILVVTNDRTFRSYRLPDMSDERAFKIDIPPDCQVWDKPHYSGYRNYVDTAYKPKDPVRDAESQAIVLYDDTGAVVHTFEGIGAGGHYDWSPDGRLAYFKMSLGARSPGGPRPLEIRVVNLDGTNDRLLFSVPREQAAGIQNLHLSWPKKVNDWFIASLFPYPQFLPAAQVQQAQQGQQEQPAATRASPGRRVRGDDTARQPSPARPARGRRERGAGAAPAPLAQATGGPLDEIVMIRLDGTFKYLAHSVTWYGRNMFWAEPLGVVRSDGKRICFHTRRSGTIDVCILFLDEGAAP